MNKECLITIGATAKFPELISAALMPGCLQKLKDNGFTHLNIQYGDSKELFETLRPGTLMGLDIQGFDFNQNGLHNEMARCQAREGISQNGMIICHAGAGTILDVMRMDIPLIVVPNHTLLDNHQEELADELEKQGYVTKGTTNNLSEAIEIACKKATKAWGGHESRFSSVIDEVAGYDVGYEEEVRVRLD